MKKDKTKTEKTKPETWKPKVEVRNPRYKGATPEMVAKALVRQVKEKPKG